MTRTKLITLAAIIFALCVACASEPAATPEESAPEATPEASPEPEEEPEAEPPVEEQAPGDHEIAVSVEVYERTFAEIEETIAELNRVIQAKDFRRWQQYLTREYIETYSDPLTLERLSETPILERNNIELTSLRDYFDWVVVPSRANARLDDLHFVSEDQVEAIMEVRGQRVILYQLSNLGGDWKVDEF